MIPRLNRLPTTRLNSSKLINSENFTLRFANNSLTYNRFAFVVGKKIDKGAVVRNRLKRVLRELSFKNNLLPEGIDLLFIVKKNFIDTPSVEVEKEVNGVLSQIHI